MTGVGAAATSAPTGGRSMNMGPQARGPGPAHGSQMPMGTGSLGMGAMANSLMPGGGMAVSAGVPSFCLDVVARR